MTGEELEQYVGRREESRDIVTLQPIEELAALLDCETSELLAGGNEIPPLAHWLFFNRWVRQSQLGHDGHPKRGGFMPPIALPRRMYAAGRLEFVDPIRLGDTIERLSTISSIVPKTGASGELVFVTVRDEIRTQRGQAIVEERDIVYRGAPDTNGSVTNEGTRPAPGIPDGAWQQTIDPTAVLLFRFSALTSNGHRIHYDRRYATAEEHYDGLVVHAPLQAMLLTNLLRMHVPNAQIERFVFRARRPIFDTSPFVCVGHPHGKNPAQVELSTRDARDEICMSATATFRERTASAA